jgi:type IV pilus assembly protein PilO
MPDFRQTRKKMKTALAILLGVDAVAVAVFFSPLVGSTASRRQEINQLWSELQFKTRQVEPLRNLDKKVVVANEQITDFYKKRFPTQESQIVTQFGKLAAANGVTMEQAKYKVQVDEVAHLHAVEMEANLTGSYVSLAKFINALERDDMFFIIDGIGLVSEQKGPIKLQMKLGTYLKAGT